jgi:hypothetical protein
VTSRVSPLASCAVTRSWTASKQPWSLHGGGGDFEGDDFAPGGRASFAARGCGAAAGTSRANQEAAKAGDRARIAAGRRQGRVPRGKGWGRGREGTQARRSTFFRARSTGREGRRFDAWDVTPSRGTGMKSWRRCRRWWRSGARGRLAGGGEVAAVGAEGEGVDAPGEFGGGEEFHLGGGETLDLRLLLLRIVGGDSCRRRP